MTYRIKSGPEPRKPNMPNLKGVPEPQRSPSPFDNLDKEEAEEEPIKEKHKRGDYRLTPQGSLLMSTIPAFAISSLIFAGMLIWDNGSIVCEFLFLQAFISFMVSGAFLLAGVIEADVQESDYRNPFPYPVWLTILGFVLIFPVGVGLLGKKVFDVSVEKVE